MFAILCLSIFLQSPPVHLSLLAQDIASEEIQATIQDRFAEAVETFNSVERANSKEMFDALLAELLAKETALDEDELFIRVQCLKFLAVLTYPEETEFYFKELLKYDPSFQPSPGELSPKIAADYEDLRNKTVGRIQVSVRDAEDNFFLAGARFIVNGEDRGLIQGESTFSVLAGTLQIEVQRENYESFFQEVAVNPSTQIAISAALARNASEIVVVTVPADVEVDIEAEEKGFTREPVPTDYTGLLSSMGSSRDEAGALTLSGFQPGRYRLTLKKPCFKNASFDFEITENKRLLLNPIQLEPSGASLTVTTPGEANGIAFLDQDRLGFLPISAYKICPGEYTLRVQFSDGEYIKNISVEDGQSLELSAEPLPSIAWFGIQESDEGLPNDDVGSWLEELALWNVLKIDSQDTSRVATDPFAALFAAQKMSQEDADGLTARLKADVYIAARVTRRKVVIRFLEVAVWTPLSRNVNVYSFDFRQLNLFKDLLTEMDRFPTLTRPWIGLQAASEFGREGLRILEIHPDGPTQGKLQMGQRLLTLNGTPLTSPAQFENITSTQLLNLETDQGSVTIEPIETIAELPYEPSTRCPQTVIAMLEKLSKYHSNPLIRESSAFNMARYHLYMGDFKASFDQFSTMTLDKPYGIGQGTLFYYQGLCFRKLGLASEATAAFQQVLSYPKATLFSAYGPSAAFWAEAELNNPGL
jgi:hypothetical protein